MQPNFTLKKLGLVGIKIFAIALIFTLSTQTSFSQENRSLRNVKKGQVDVSTQKKSTSGVKPTQNELAAAKRSFISSMGNRVAAPVSADNDAGRPNRVTVQNRPPSTEAVCATFTGALAPGDLTMTNRLNRNNVQGVCPGPKPFAPSLTGNTYYDVHTWTNNSGLAQCATFTLTTTDVTTNIEFGVWNGSFNPANLGTNFFTDPGVSSATPPAPTSCSANVAAGQTLVFVVFTPNAALQTASDYTLTVELPICATAPCSGTPAPGATLSSAPSACPGVPFTLSLTNSTAGAGVTYQWQSATTLGGTYTNIGGATNPTYATSLTATTFYRCNVTCSAGPSTGTSTPVGVTLNPPSACYCEPSYSSGCGFGDFIANVTFESINNTTVCTATPSYTYYSAIPAPDLIAGGTYPLSVTVGPDTFGQFVGVWVDFNKDGDFNDAGEFLTIPPTDAGANGTVVVNVAVPTNAALGLTRLRVRAGDDVAMTAGQSCGASNSAFGEAEDYNINILPCSPVIITGHPSNSSIACGGNTTFTAAAAGNVLSYQWQTRADPTVPQTMTFTNNTVLPVPDNSGAGVYSTITVAGIPAGAIISNVSIRVNIDHTYVGDMENNIIAPNGVSMSLMAELDNGTGSNSSNNFTNSVFSSSSTTPISGVAAPRTGTFAADRLQGYGPSANAQTLASGMAWSNLYSVLNGDWRLGLSDWFAGDVGQLNNWSITFTYTAPTAWVNVTNGGIYSGATTSTLALNNVSQSFTGNQYRAVVTGFCSGPDFTNAATLTVTPVVPVVNPASATICLGSVQQLSLTNSASSAVTQTFTSGTVSIPIPESPGGVASGTSTIAVAGIPVGAVITNMKVKLNMTHSWVGDVCYVVKAPNGKVLNLDYFLSETGGPGTDFVNTTISSDGVNLLSSGTSPGFTGTFKADAGIGSLIPAATAGPVGFVPDVTSFNALYSTPNGNYTLAFFDYFVDPAPGTFTKWDLEITYVSPVLVQGTWTGPAGTMFTDAGATIPYTGTLATTIYVKPTVNSNYQVSFTTPTPCTSSVTTVPVNVVTPLSNVANPVNTSACLGNTATFTSATVTGGPFVRQWQESVNSGLTWTNIAGATGATLTLTNVTQIMNNNLYRVNYTAAPCVGTISSASAKLTVNPLPVVTISAPDLALTPGQTTLISGSSTPAAISWSWTRDGAPIAGTTNTQTVNINTLGAYQATAVDNQTPGCTAKSNILVIGSESSDRLWIYPNPTTGAFQARLYFQSDLSEKRIVTIYNSLGQEITSQRYNLLNITAPYLQMDFDLSKLARGTYVVKVVHEFTGKIVSGLVLVQ